MKFLFLPENLSKKVIEKGYKGKRFGYYKDKQLVTTDVNYKGVKFQGEVNAPLYQQVVDWFLLKHSIKVDYTKGRDLNYAPKVIEYEKNKEHCFDYSLKHICKTHTAALNKAIEEALKFI